MDMFQRISGAEAAKVEAESAQNIANYNAALQEREAEALEAKGQFEQVRHAKRGERVMSSLQAREALLTVEAEQAAELELENLLIGYEHEIGAQRALSQAELDRLSGRVAKLKGRNLALARDIELGKTLLTGFGGAFV